MIREAPSAKVSWKLLNDTLLLRLAAGQFFCVTSGNRAQRLKVAEHPKKDPRSMEAEMDLFGAHVYNRP